MKPNFTFFEVAAVWITNINKVRSLKTSQNALSLEWGYRRIHLRQLDEPAKLKLGLFSREFTDLEVGWLNDVGIAAESPTNEKVYALN